MAPSSQESEPPGNPGRFKAFEAALEIGNGAAFTDLVEIGFSEIAIDHAPGEHVIGGHDDLVSNGEGGTQSAATGLEAGELVLQIAAFGSRRGDRESVV